MPIVRFKGYGETEVPVGASILDAAQKVDAPEGYACGGVCACSTCHVYVLEGRDLLSEQEEEEEDILDKAFDVRHNSRLGCQSAIQKDGVVEVDHAREPRGVRERAPGAPRQVHATRGLRRQRHRRPIC